MYFTKAPHVRFCSRTVVFHIVSESFPSSTNCWVYFFNIYNEIITFVVICLVYANANLSQKHYRKRRVWSVSIAPVFWTTVVCTFIMVQLDYWEINIIRNFFVQAHINSYCLFTKAMLTWAFTFLRGWTFALERSTLGHFLPLGQHCPQYQHAGK